MARKALADARHGGGRLVPIDRDAHDLRARARERRHLPRGRLHIGRVGVGHRLHDDRSAAADDHAADIDRDRAMARRDAVIFHADGFLHGSRSARKLLDHGGLRVKGRVRPPRPACAHSPRPSRSSAASSVASCLAKQKRTTVLTGALRIEGRDRDRGDAVLLHEALAEVDVVALAQAARCRR